MALELDPTGLGIEVGGAGVIGGIAGYAAKKVAKVIAVLVGLEVALFKFLEARGILEVNWAKLSSAATNTTQQVAATGETPPSWVSSLLATLPVGAGFTGGFMLGFKRG